MSGFKLFSIISWHVLSCGSSALLIDRHCFCEAFSSSLASCADGSVRLHVGGGISEGEGGTELGVFEHVRSDSTLGEHERDSNMIESVCDCGVLMSLGAASGAGASGQAAAQ